MISPDYAASQMTAVWRMVWNRPGWQNTLDRSVDGVFNSFWAIVFAAPFSLLGFLSVRRFAAQAASETEAALAATPFVFSLIVHAVAFLIDWGAGLAVLILAVRALAASARAADVIIGFNWIQVFINIAMSLPFATLGLSGERNVATLLFLPATMFVLAVMWGFLRRSLSARPAAAIALMLLLTLVGVLTNVIVGGIAGLFLQALS